MQRLKNYRVVFVFKFKKNKQYFNFFFLMCFFLIEKNLF